MKTRLLLLLVLLAGCASVDREAPRPIRGRIVLETIPNPLVARSLGGDTYEVTFDLIMREEGGVDTRIDDFTVDAIALGGVVVKSETHPATYITSRGYPSNVAAGQHLRFTFVKRWTLPTALLLSGAAVRVTARTTDANGAKDVTTFRAAVNRASDPVGLKRRSKRLRRTLRSGAWWSAESSGLAGNRRIGRSACSTS